jgi:hypothetical protein
MSHETFGGNVNKRNYGGISIVDPTTDTSAEQGVDATRVLSRAQWMMPFAELEVTIGTDTPSSSVNSYVGQNGVGLSHAPTITREAQGILQIQWPATFTDEYGITGTLNITRAKAWPNGTNQLLTNIDKIDERTVWVYFLDSTDASALDNYTAVVQVSTMGDT